jgi:hypothetical protein
VPGQYCLRIQASKNGHTSYGRETVEVSGQDVENVVISVSTGGEMPGSVLFESAPPAEFKDYRVSLRPLDSGPGYPNAPVKADNTFVLSDVLPIDYELQSMQKPRNFYLKSVQYGNRDVSDGRIHVTASGTPLTLVLASDSAQLSVTVQGSDGSPAPRAMIVAVPQGTYSLRRDLMQTGGMVPTSRVAQMNGLAPGDYKLYAFADIPWNLTQIPEFFQLLETRATSVTLAPSDKQSVQVTLIPVEAVNEAKSKLE